MKHSWWLLFALVACDGSRSAIADALRSADSQTRIRATWTLAARGADGAWAVPTLCDLLADPTSGEFAIWALAEIGPAAIAARDPLVAMLADDNPQVRSAAAWALGRIGADDDLVRSELTRLAADPDERVRLGAIGALRKL